MLSPAFNFARHLAAGTLLAGLSIVGAHAQTADPVEAAPAAPVEAAPSEGVDASDVVGPKVSIFQRDLSGIETLRRLGLRIVADLKVGDAMDIRTYDLCVDASGGLALPKATEEEDTFYSVGFRVMRSESGVSLQILKHTDHKLDPDVLIGPDEYRDTIEVIEGIVGCSYRFEGSDPGHTFPVESINGMSSLSQLVETYEQLASAAHGAVATGEKEEEEEEESIWRVSQDTDRITDQTNVFVMGDSTLPIYSFGTAKYPTMVMRCQRNTTSLYIIHGDYEINDTMSVAWRIDDAKPKTVRWTSSSDHKAVGLWSGGGAIPFLRGLQAGKRLTLRIRGRSDTYDLEYDLTGLQEGLSKVAETCNWEI